MTWQETMTFLTGCLPRQLGRMLLAQKEGDVREIRVRAEGRASVLTASEEVTSPGTYTQQQVAQMAEALCEHALYARAQEQRQGFVTLRGGHRMGLCGRVVTSGQSVRALREISSFCVRVAGQWYGAADALMPFVQEADGRIHSTLIVGLPGSGKTTMLREMCRMLSGGGARVCVVDERSELAAMHAGVPQLDIGPRTDVLDGCAKETGLRWLLRSMSPQVLVTDELGSAADVQAVCEAAKCGVSVMASLHGRELETALSRGPLYQLAQNRIFTRYVLLHPFHTGRIAAVCDEKLCPLCIQEAV